MAKVSVNADWDDVDAAALVAARAVEAVVSKTIEVSPTQRRYLLKHVDGETGEVNVVRVDAGRDEGIEMEATCRIGRLGDPERDRAFLRALGARLIALRGVEFAPLGR